MNPHVEYIKNIDEPLKQEKVEELLLWITDNYPSLTPVIKWNEPMFILNNTFIIGFSISKKHIAVSPEVKGIQQHEKEIDAANYEHTKNIIRIKWGQTINYELIKNIIDFNIVDKENSTAFWR
ncbi:MAG: DUF1801 domain-containing protein [Vagococcus sp.]|jgi:uncharacterized protein YdhG (YjbR/CyaY superfamily)|nr:DUF1801 domain-containing protein [Vagococcus sp.]